MSAFGVTTGSPICPCSCVQYRGCCGVFHHGEIPETPEQLLRSRYSAYVFELSDYLEATWHPKTRPERINFDPSTTWLGLDIKEQVTLEGPREMTAISFTAEYTDARGRWELAETSTFERRGGRWFYLDGDAKFRQI